MKHEVGSPKQSAPSVHCESGNATHAASVSAVVQSTIPGDENRQHRPDGGQGFGSHDPA